MGGSSGGDRDERDPSEATADGCDLCRFATSRPDLVIEERAGWTLAASLRNASVLWRGRPVESVPADMRDADGIGRIIGRPPGAQSTLEEDYLRVARRSRAATDQNFYQSRQNQPVSGNRQE